MYNFSAQSEISYTWQPSTIKIIHATPFRDNLKPNDSFSLTIFSGEVQEEMDQKTKKCVNSQLWLLAACHWLWHWPAPRCISPSLLLVQFSFFLHFFNAMHLTWHCSIFVVSENCQLFLKSMCFPRDFSFLLHSSIFPIILLIKPTWGMYRKYWLDWSLTKGPTWLKITSSWTPQLSRFFLTLLKLYFDTLFIA